jgi:hypothetical protein
MKIFYTLVFLVLVVLIGGFVYNTYMHKEPEWRMRAENPDDITSGNPVDPQRRSNFDFGR